MCSHSYHRTFNLQLLLKHKLFLNILNAWSNNGTLKKKYWILNYTCIYQILY